MPRTENAFALPPGAAALMRTSARRACTSRHAVRTVPCMKKIARGKGAHVQEDESNAVDVFGGSSLSAEELLAAALAGIPKEGHKTAKEPLRIDAAVSNDEAAVKAKKKKKKKKGIMEDDSNAVDVFAAVDTDEILSEALGTKSGSDGEQKDTLAFSGESSTDFVRQEKKKMKKGKTPDTILEELSEETEPEIEVCAEVEGVEQVMEHEDDDITKEDDINFVPDQDVISEFESFSDGVADFTLAGRRKKAKKSREGRFVNPKHATYGSGGEKYTSVRLEDVSVTFRSCTVLRGVTWGVQTGERVGLVGENGCGKTTQLKILAGLMKPTEGEIVTASSRTKAAFLRQEFVDELDPRRTLREEFSSAFRKEKALIDKYYETEREITEAGDDLAKLEKLLNRLEEVRLECDQLDVWNIDTRIDKVMPGLGFDEEDNDKLVASFSGGWKVRIGIGKVLMQDPDLLLLDEPSNHLDNDSVEWLEQFLQHCSLPMVIVSHDREFLDRVATKIVEIEGGEAVSYPGNYSRFLQLKAERRKAWEAAYEKQQRFIAEQRTYINTYRRSPARVSQVKSRERMLERMEKNGELVRRPPHAGKPLVFRFPPAPRSGREVICVEGLCHGYEGRPLFKDANIEIERGDRIALIGPNGSGKSTLLRLITGQETPQEGRVDCESLHNVRVAYYEQNQADALDLDITVLKTLQNAAPSDYRYEDIRALLGKFLFKGDDVEKRVSALSGGEKARLALAKIMLEPANVLVLDEPGNHLSISAKEMLEEALQHFDGTLLIVSHDRYLLSQVATQIVAVEGKELVLYDGDYKSYMEKNQALFEKLRARFIPGVAEIKNAPKIVVQEDPDELTKKIKRKKKFGGSGVVSGRIKEMNAKRWKK